MATINQISTLLNQISSEMFGDTALTVNDLSGLIALGEQVLSSQTSKEQFTNILADRIGLTKNRTLDYVGFAPKIVVNEVEYGSAIQKINIQPFEASIQNAWNIGDDEYQTRIWDINKPQISQTFFNKYDTWEVDVTIPDDLLKQSFTSFSAMDSFISAVFDMFNKSMDMQLDFMKITAIDNLIGEKLASGSNVINLLDLYNTTYSPETSLTQAKALTSAEFLRFATRIIKMYIKYMENPSKLYNDGDMVRATRRDNMHVLMLSDFVSAYVTNLQSDTFNKEMVELPYYEEIPYWQGTGTSEPSFTSVSSLYVKTSSGSTVGRNGIVCLLADREAVGVTIKDRFIASDRNNREKYTNYTNGATMGYFNDLSENVVVFTIEDSE